MWIVGVNGHSINQEWYFSKLVYGYILCDKRNIGQLSHERETNTQVDEQARKWLIPCSL
jgi:hypothetical protein